MNEPVHTQTPAMRPRRVWIAVLLSLLAAGVGHLYAGRGRRGVVLLALALAPVPLIYLLAFFAPALGVAYTLIGLVIFGMGLTLFALFDAGRVAARAKSPYQRRAYNHGGLYLAIIAFATMWSLMGSFFLKEHAFEVYRIPTASMDPTVRSGDRVLVNKFHGGHLEHGDVIVFRSPGAPPRNYIKRVVALGGERVRIDAEGQLWVSDEVVQRTPSGPDGGDPVRETLAGRSYFVRNLGARQAVDLVVPEKHVYVLGDNRANSHDSRAFGPVPLDDIEGVMEYIWAGSDGSLHLGIPR